VASDYKNHIVLL